MTENDEMKVKESGIKIVMHDFESVFPKEDPSVIGNFINSMSVGLWPIFNAVIKPINVHRISKKRESKICKGHHTFNFMMIGINCCEK